jgi:NADPH2:quinone reductase
MRAAVYRIPGSAREVLTVENVGRPEPGPGEVLVRVRVSGVNPTDFKTRAGATARPIEEFQVPNQDGAGIIEAVGAGVDAARIGQRVWVWFAAFNRRWGTAAEYTVVPERQAVELPDGASFELGASLGVPAMTAHRALLADGPVDGRNVLVAGGAGAVGHYAIELAKYFGARVVTTVSSKEKGAIAAKAGADLVVNYKDEGAIDQVRAFAPVMDRIVEVALGANLELDLAVAGPQTSVVTYAADGNDPTIPVRACMSANVNLRFMLLYGVPAPALDQAVTDITAAIRQGALTELPVHRFALDDTVAAHEAVESGAVGKVIIAPLPAARVTHRVLNGHPSI